MWFRSPSTIHDPAHPFMPDRQDFLVGSGVDAGLFLTRFGSSREFGGRWVLSDSPLPSIEVAGEVMSAQYASGGTDGGRVWFKGASLNCYPVRGDYIITTAAPGYWPAFESWYDEQDELQVSGDGWYTARFPSVYTDDNISARAAGVYLYDESRKKGIGPVKIHWPRLAWGGNWSSNTNPCRVYTTAFDGMDGPKTVGLPQWTHGAATYTQGLESTDGEHWANYGRAKWTSAANAYTIGNYGQRWQQAAPPAAGSSWQFTGWASGADGASAVPSEDFTATWNGYQFGHDVAVPVYVGQVSFFS